MKQLNLIIMHGPPASGKSTYAKQWQQEDPNNRVIVCREDLCNMLGVHPATVSAMVNGMELACINTALIAGKDVIIDSTRKLDWEFLLDDTIYLNDEVNIEYKEFGADLTVDELIERDRTRGSKTGEEVIKKWKR
jgi:predicted kinase